MTYIFPNVYYYMCMVLNVIFAVVKLINIVWANMNNYHIRLFIGWCWICVIIQLLRPTNCLNVLDHFVGLAHKKVKVFGLSGYRESLLLFISDVGLHLNKIGFQELGVVDEYGSVIFSYTYWWSNITFSISICHIYRILPFISVFFSIAICWIFIMRVEIIIIKI